jgi:hypothetical protein
MKRSSLLIASIAAAFALMLTAVPIDYHAGGGALAAEIGNLPSPTPKPDASSIATSSPTRPTRLSSALPTA